MAILLPRSLLGSVESEFHALLRFLSLGEERCQGLQPVSIRVSNEWVILHYRARPLMADTIEISAQLLDIEVDFLSTITSTHGESAYIVPASS